VSPLSRKALAAAVLLLALHFMLAVGSKLHECTTSDEIVHLTGGFAYWRFNDYRLQPENGNLPQRWVAIPAVLSGAKFPDLDQEYWRTSDAWVMGHEFFYETGEDHFPRLMAARAMTALFGVALGALVFLWSRRLFGTPGALVSLTFFAFSPTLLAHGGLATSDVCMALFMLASVGAYWRHLGRPGAAGFALSAVVLGLACVAKFSAPLLGPMLLICGLVRLAARRGELWRVLRSTAGHVLVAFAVIWAFYGFRYSAFSPAVPAADRFIAAWSDLYARIGSTGRLIHVLADHHVLPEAFLYGASYVADTSSQRGAFLNGEYSVFGWKSFFLWTFALKSTIPFMVAAALGIWVAVRSRIVAGADRARHLERLLPYTPLAALFLVYWAVSIRSHLNIGHRHLIPTYPVLFILVGSLGTWLARPLRPRALLLAALEDEGPEGFPSPPRHPVRAVRAYSLDPSLRAVEICEDNRWRSAWDFQDELWEIASTYAKKTGGEAVGDEEEVSLVLREWREMLDGVRDDLDAVADRVDWVAKQRIVNGIQERHGLNAHDAKLRAIDLQYHDLRPEKSLAQRVGLKTLLRVDEVREAVHNPPRTTRAYFRGRCVARYPDQIAAANWDSVVFDLGEGPLQRVPMMDPLRGTAALTEDLLEVSSTANELLRALDR